MSSIVSSPENTVAKIRASLVIQALGSSTNILMPVAWTSPLKIFSKMWWGAASCIWIQKNVYIFHREKAAAYRCTATGVWKLKHFFQVAIVRFKHASLTFVLIIDLILDIRPGIQTRKVLEMKYLITNYFQSPVLLMMQNICLAKAEPACEWCRPYRSAILQCSL